MTPGKEASQLDFIGGDTRESLVDSKPEPHLLIFVRPVAFEIWIQTVYCNIKQKSYQKKPHGSKIVIQGNHKNLFFF